MKTLENFINTIFDKENDNRVKKRLPCIPDTKEQIKTFCEILPQYSLTDNKNRLCSFLGQIHIESAGFTSIKEGLYYSKAESILRNFRSHFRHLNEEEKTIQANKLTKNSNALAEYVYPNTFLKGGKPLYGRGYIQISIFNYKWISQEMYGNDTLLKHPEILENYKEGLIASCIYWNKNNINKYADILDCEGITKSVNGSAMLHLKERTEKTKEYLEIFEII